MNNLSLKRLFIILILFSFTISVCESQTFDRAPVSSHQKKVSHKGPLKTKTVKVKGPKAAEKSKKQQEVKQGRLKKDYRKYVKENQKRSIEIQSPEVKARMKENIKNADASYTAKHKHSSSRTRKAGKKYR